MDPDDIEVPFPPGLRLTGTVVVKVKTVVDVAVVVTPNVLVEVIVVTLVEV